MALNEKERDRIVEEEKLRFETRRGLEREWCGKHRPNRWLWWLAVGVLAYVVWCWLACGRGICSHRGMGWHGQMGGHRCPYGDKMMEDADGEAEKGADEGQPKAKPAVKPAKVAPAPAAKK